MAKPEYNDDRLDDADRQALRKALEAYPKVVPLLEQAAACPDYQTSVDYTTSATGLMDYQLKDVQHFRAAINVLALKSRLQVAAGDRDGALATAGTMFRLARHLEHEPLVIGHLVLIACRAVACDMAHKALRAGPVSAKARDALDAVLAEADDPRAYLFALRSECAYGMDMIRTLGPNTWFTRAYFNDELSAEIDLINRLVELTDKPYADVAAFDAAWRQDRAMRRPLTNLIAPALIKVREARDRCTALLRTLRVLNALQRRDRTDVPTLADLGLPAGATVDPYTGKPLTVKKLAGGWLVYAVGPDLTDNGGDVTSRKDIGFAPPEEKKKGG
jgi:hypothetical protein